MNVLKWQGTFEQNEAYPAQYVSNMFDSIIFNQLMHAEIMKHLQASLKIYTLLVLVCQTSIEEVVEEEVGATLFSLLKSLFNDLNLDGIGDLASSSANLVGDKDDKFSLKFTGISIINTPDEDEGEGEEEDGG